MLLIRRLFQQQVPPLMGLDIGTSAVRLLALEATSSGYRVEACASAPLASGVVVDGNIAHGDMAAQAVAGVVRQSGSKLRNVAMGVPGSLVISRQISMPVEFTDAAIEEQITLESDQFIPYPLDDVFFDFVVIGPNARNPQTSDVLLIVARREVVEHRLQTLGELGLTASVMDVEAYALESAFPLIEPGLPPVARNGVTAMIDIGGNSTTLNVLHRGVTIFTREQSFGGEQLLQQLQDRYDLSLADARAALSGDRLPNDSRATVIEPFLESLASQVARLVQVFFSATGETTLDQVVLSGGCAGLPGAADVVGKHLGIETQVGNPFASVQFKAGLDAGRLRATGHAWMIAAGLAMRSTSDVAR